MREVKKFLFARQSKIGHLIGGKMEYPSVFVAVEGFDKDHAISRLEEAFPYVVGGDWDFLEYLDPEHFLGGLGHDLPLPISQRFALKRTMTRN